MVCDGVLHSNRILKTLKMSVISKNLLHYQIHFQSKNLCFIFFYQKKNSVNNFYVVLIFYSYVERHHISVQPNCYIWKIL